MAIISPIIPIVKMLPILERSRLVVVPITAIAPKVPAVIRKVLAIDAHVNAKMIGAKTTPVSTE